MMSARNSTRPGLELLGRDVVAVLGGLPDGVGDGVGLFRREVGVGQRAGDSVRVEHRFRVPRTTAAHIKLEGLLEGLCEPIIGKRAA